MLCNNLLKGDKMKYAFKRMWEEIEGQDLVEYGLLIVLISLFAVVSMKGLANGISDVFSNAAAQLGGGGGGAAGGRFGGG